MEQQYSSFGLILLEDAGVETYFIESDWVTFNVKSPTVITLEEFEIVPELDFLLSAGYM